MHFLNQGKNADTPMNSPSSRPLLTQLSCLAVLALGAFASVAAPSPQTGGIVPTEYSPISVDPGPAPDVTFFVTGDTMGKIEPCG